MLKFSLYVLAAAVPTLIYAAPAPNPTYLHEQEDAFFTHEGNGAYSVDTSAESYVDELWERSFEDNKASVSGSKVTTSGKYYAFGDLWKGGYGFDDNFLYIRFESRGTFMHEAGKSDTSEIGLKGHYYFYFGLENSPTNRFVVNVDDGTSVSDSGFSSIGKVYQDSNGDVGGTSFTETYDSTNKAEGDASDGFEDEISNANVLSRRSNAVLEIAVELGSINLTRTDIEGAYDFAHIGISVSNPSANTDLFANDQFPESWGNGVEYDTMAFQSTIESGGLPIPEPSSLILLGCGFFTLLSHRKRL